MEPGKNYCGWTVVVAADLALAGKFVIKRFSLKISRGTRQADCNGSLNDSFVPYMVHAPKFSYSPAYNSSTPLPPIDRDGEFKT